MIGIHFQASVNNLSLMDRLQQNQHQAPAVDQQQNIETTKQNGSKRIKKPVEPDRCEAMKVEAHKEKRPGKRKGAKKKSGKQTTPAHRRDRGGNFVDYTV